jgi:hypothetical protein
MGVAFLSHYLPGLSPSGKARGNEFHFSLLLTHYGPQRSLVALAQLVTVYGCDSAGVDLFSLFAAARSQYVQKFHQLTAASQCRQV